MTRGIIKIHCIELNLEFCDITTHLFLTCELLRSPIPYNRCGHSVTGTQIASFAFTFWRFVFTLTHKYMMRNKERPRGKSVVLNLVEIDAVDIGDVITSLPI